MVRGSNKRMDNGLEIPRKPINTKFWEELNDVYSNSNPSVYRSRLEVML
jgi:hypothetical protein